MLEEDRMRWVATSCVLLMLWSLPAVAARKSEAVPVAPQVLAVSGTTPEGLQWASVDFNGDQFPEVKSYYQQRTDGPRALRLREIDLNRDGKIDVVTTYDDLGNREREEMDTDFDGKMDVIDVYVAGKRQSSQVDTDYDGSYDLVRYYEAGKVRRKERDTNLDGRVDFVEQLDENGVVLKIGRDSDGDGVIDQRE